MGKFVYRSPSQESIAEVIRVVELFPRFVEEEDNLALMEEVNEEGLKAVLQSSKSIKVLVQIGVRSNFLYNIMRTWVKIF